MSLGITPYASDELAVAALFWTKGSFEDHLAEWMPANRALLQEILWGRPGTDTPHVRPNANGKTPAQVRAARRYVPTQLTREAVLEALPGAYEAPPWRGFAHTEAAFRDWHVATQEVTDSRLAWNARQLLQAGVIDWAYIVSAAGQRTHTHALVSFRFGHPMDFVRAALVLPQEARLTPVHTDFGSAKIYLDNQALRKTELGRRPNRRILRDGNKDTTDDKLAALEAIRTGEVTTILRQRTEGAVTGPEARARDGWMANAARSPRTEHRAQAQTRAEARADATRRAADYSGRWFEVDFRVLLPGSFFRETPPGWFGEEVVVLLSVPASLVSSQLSAAWLRSVPEVVYTVA